MRVRMDSYRVFNAEQFAGLSDRFHAEPERDEPDLHAVHRFFGAIDAKMKEGGQRASYSPSEDLIRVPWSVWSRGGAEYFATLAHELALRGTDSSSKALTVGAKLFATLMRIRRTR